ncbi:MAG: YceI family protein [Cyclobacteriaceae bacterium]
MKYLSFLIVSIFFFSACQSGNDSSSSQSELSNPKKNYPNADSIKIDLKKSIATWIGSKPTGQHDGTFEFSSGYLLFSEKKIVGGEILIDISSLKVMDIEDQESSEKLARHLLSDDFFSSSAFPEGSFRFNSVKEFDSTYTFKNKVEFPSKFKPASESSFIVTNPNYVVTGYLKLKGVEKTISFPAKIDVMENKIIAEAKFNLDRILWGLSYNDESSILDKAKDKFIYNTVNVGFYVEAPISDN